MAKTDSTQLVPGIQANIAGLNSEAILTRIEADRDVTAIPVAFYLLLSTNLELKRRVARSLSRLVDSLTSGQLLKIDSLFRERTSFEWNYDWKMETPMRLVESELTDTEKVMVLGLASFHPNGYFRESAVQALAAFETGRELPFLVIRLNDWVAKIRVFVTWALTKRMNVNYAHELVRCLPIIFHLRQCERVNHESIIEQLVAVLTSPEGRTTLIDGLMDRDYKVRSLCFGLITEQMCCNRQKLWNYLKDEPIPSLRIKGLRRLEPLITAEEYWDNKVWLEADNSAQIRAWTLEISFRFSTADCLADLKKGLLDRAACVRETSRFLLKRIGLNLDLRIFYQESLSEIPIGAIAGLGEIGNAEDADQIEPYLANEIVRIVKTAMGSVAKLNFTKYSEKLLLLLTDERPGISKTARVILTNKICSSDVKIVEQGYRKGIAPHIRKNCACLLVLLGKWESLGFILEFQASSEEEIRMMGKAALKRWMNRYNRSFTSPTRKQLEVVKEAMDQFGSSIGEDARKFLEFNLKSFEGK